MQDVFVGRAMRRVITNDFVPFAFDPGLILNNEATDRTSCQDVAMPVPI